VAQADRLHVRVEAAGRTIEGGFNRVRHENQLIVEVNFVDGYPQGERAQVSVTAYTGQQALETAVLPPLLLEPGCTGTQVALGTCPSGTLCPMAGGGLGCVDLRSDAENCGACSRACDGRSATPLCSDGQCVDDGCAAGFLDCDGERDNGCEIDARTDQNHCGACGRACSLSRTCWQGQCQ
jgi:hypothetical protein